MYWPVNEPLMNDNTNKQYEIFFKVSGGQKVKITTLRPLFYINGLRPDFCELWL